MPLQIRRRAVSQTVDGPKLVIGGAMPGMVGRFVATTCAAACQIWPFTLSLLSIGLMLSYLFVFVGHPAAALQPLHPTILRMSLWDLRLATACN